MLDDRKSAILKAVVQQYIETAQPVGSTNIVEQTDIGVSSATVRNEMTLLEREGYLAQPHTSRRPHPDREGLPVLRRRTGRARRARARQQTRQVRTFFAHAHGELEEMLKDTSRLLSHLTATTAVVVGEAGESATVRSVQLVGLAGRTILVVVVTSQGVVHKRTVDHDTDVADDELARAAAAVVGRASSGEASHEPLATDVDRRRCGRPAGAIAGGDRGDGATEADKHVYVEGASRIAGAFDATVQLREILGILEQQLSVVDAARRRAATVASPSPSAPRPAWRPWPSARSSWRRSSSAASTPARSVCSARPA